MNDLTSRVAEAGAAVGERHALWEWVTRRRLSLRRNASELQSGTFVDGYAAALDDVENLLLVRDQRA